MSVFSQIDPTKEVSENRWVVSLVCTEGMLGHLILVFEGKQPNIEQGWLWACDFVPENYAFNDAHKKDNISIFSGVFFPNIIGTGALIRSTHPYEELKALKQFTLGDDRFSNKSHYFYKSWQTSSAQALKIQKEINEEQALSKREHDEKKKWRTFCYRYGGNYGWGNSGYNCSTWAIEKIKKCLSDAECEQIDRCLMHFFPGYVAKDLNFNEKLSIEEIEKRNFAQKSSCTIL